MIDVSLFCFRRSNDKTMSANLDRFVAAQATAYAQALVEIRSGRKRSHWMWFIFPQLKGLGYSSNANYYGIDGLAEATAYMQHPILGTRLIEISRALLNLPGSNATSVMGSPDDMKLRSSITLFSLVKGADPVFGLVLDKYFQSHKDDQTIALLSNQ
jgi:uncharacterized protein (DUF1810 family)